MLMKIKALKAFTLIELIVVIAIIGVLAAILIPSLTGYVAEARTNTANANAKLVYNNAMVITSEMTIAGHVLTVDGAGNGGLGGISFSGPIPALPSAPIDVSALGDLNQAKFAQALGANMGGSTEGSAGWYKVEFYEDGSPACAWWAKSQGDVMIGSWPDARSPEDNSEGETIEEVDS
jgi:type IV pilus assembly protein PilA